MNIDEVYLIYILECIANIEDLTQKGRLALESAKHDRAAVLYYLQTMSETTQRVSDRLKQAHPEVDWVAISGFRNRLVHGYLEVNLNVVWSVIEDYLPSLKRASRQMLNQLDDDK